MKYENNDVLRKLSRDIRIDILNICEKTSTGHVGSAFSVVEILVVIYSKIIKGRYPDPDRDRVILSKGHACVALYSILNRFGIMDESLYSAFATNGSRLGHHPHYEPSMGLEANTGSLGHGLSIGTGLAYAAKQQNSRARTFVVLSDGDANEGSTWEAAAFAAHHRLANLCMILDANKMQAMGFTKDVLWPSAYEERWKSFGWDVIDVDGHDVNQLTEAFSRFGIINKPLAIIANTVKGKGVSFMENNLLWHYRHPKDQEYLDALKELSI
ncbi:MAG TPA: transketolase [Bacteroidales bacterium]|jgi:transketolase|nr:transketolase [Bacteroidales bacterium]